MIISLTTIPSRMPHLGLTIQSLLNQRVAADKIIINVPRQYKRFGMAPPIVSNHPLVQINMIDVDWGPATKLLGALRLVDDDPIIVVDDDRVYSSDLTERLMFYYDLFPRFTICDFGIQMAELIGEEVISDGRLNPRYDATRAGFVDTLFGFGGFITRREFYKDDVFEVPEECFFTDDVYLSGYLTSREVPIWCVNGKEEPKCHQAHWCDGLVFMKGNDSRLTSNLRSVSWCRKSFGIWTAKGS